jgi:hypothetical protein
MINHSSTRNVKANNALLAPGATPLAVCMKRNGSKNISKALFNIAYNIAQKNFSP